MRTLTVILALALCVSCAMSEDKAIESVKAISKSADEFSTSLFKTVAAVKKGENLICSPLSAHIVLSMAAYGAGGNTAVQMRQALHLPTDDVTARHGFENLLHALNNVENVTLEVANKMYVDNSLKVNPRFKQLTGGVFRSEASGLDVSKPEESAKLVNGWVDEKTHSKIKEIVEKSDITAETRIILLNAVYFKGRWAKAFKKEDTEDRTFFLDAKTEKKVPTMWASGKYVYGELSDLNASFVELPYENKDLKMVIIVPHEKEGLQAILNNLESYNQTRLAKSGSERDVIIYLPKFKIESEINLEKPLQDLGMTDMFSSAANFSEIADAPLKVDKVFQKAFIEVSEEGTEAAAVTAGLTALALIVKERIMFQADRPFYYMIKSHDLILFQGYIIKPKL